VARSERLKRLAASVRSRRAAKGDSTTFTVRRWTQCSRGYRYRVTIGYTNPEVDRLLALAAQTPVVGERAKIYAQVNAILARDLPTLILFDEVGVDAARAHLRNLWQGLDARDAWWLTWVAT
jgi:ABC-type transport system substrate-binding protein